MGEPRPHSRELMAGAHTSTSNNQTPDVNHFTLQCEAFACEPFGSRAAELRVDLMVSAWCSCARERRERQHCNRGSVALFASTTRTGSSAAGLRVPCTQTRTRPKTKSTCHDLWMAAARDATLDDIRKAYKRLALKWHPDLAPCRLVHTCCSLLQVAVCHFVELFIVLVAPFG